MQLLGTALSVALLDRGWTVSAAPGDAIVFSHNGDSITPLIDLNRLARGEMSAETWEAACRKFGLLDLDLGTLRKSASAALRGAATPDTTTRA
jgi:hypothetical protein